MDKEDLLQFGVLGFIFLGTCIVLRKTAKSSSEAIKRWRASEASEQSKK